MSAVAEAPLPIQMTDAAANKVQSLKSRRLRLYIKQTNLFLQ